MHFFSEGVKKLIVGHFFFYHFSVSIDSEWSKSYYFEEKKFKITWNPSKYIFLRSEHASSFSS